MIKNQKSISSNQAFTIVELLVVIVVIGILAAITIVSYSGIQNKAIGANLRTDLASDAKQLKMYNVEYGHYPSSLDTNYCPATPEPDNRYCLKAMNGAKLSYVGGGQFFTLFDKHTATGTTYKISEGSEPAISVLPGSFVNTYSSWSDSGGLSAVDITDDDGYAVAGGADVRYPYFIRFGSDNSISVAKVWNQTYSGEVKVIKKTSDGGVVIGGSVNYGSTNDLYIAKFSSTNQLSWAKTWGVASNGSGVNDIIQTSDGGYAAVANASADILISKFTAEGNLSWTKTYNSGVSDYAKSIIQTSDSGFAVAGYIDGDIINPSGALLLKTDSSGAFSWAKKWKMGEVTVNSEYGRDLVQTSDGGYAVAGTTNISGSKTYASITKLASDGTYQFHKYFAVTNNLSFTSMAQTYDGNYVFVGGMIDPAKSTTTTDAVVVKVSPTGSVLWSRNYGSSVDSEALVDVAPTADGGYLAVGTQGDHTNGHDRNLILVMKYKSDGTMNNCSAPICKNDLVVGTSSTILFYSLAMTATAQTYTTTSKAYAMQNWTSTKVSSIAP